MGPAPMIRMVEISVLLGIRSRGLDFGHKKRARLLRVPRAVAPGYPRRAGWSLDQIPHPRNPQKAPINREIRRNQRRLPPPDFALRATARQAVIGWLACRAEAAEQRRLEARPGFEPG